MEIYGYKGMVEKSHRELQEEISAIWKDFEIYPSKRSVELVMAPENKTEEKALRTRILSLTPGLLKIAFVHDRSPEESSWTYGHELGRHYLEDTLSERSPLPSILRTATRRREVRSSRRLSTTEIPLSSPPARSF